MTTKSLPNTITDKAESSLHVYNVLPAGDSNETVEPNQKCRCPWICAQHTINVVSKAWNSSIAQCIIQIVQLLLPCMLIYTVISEILLLIKVYAHHDGTFFALSCTFLIGPLCLISLPLSCLSCAYCNTDGEEYNASPCGRMTCVPAFTPIINIILTKWVMSEDSDGNGMHYVALLDTFLTGTMTFPLYIINLSFLLESVTVYDEISGFNILQLVCSVLSMGVTPIQYVMSATSLYRWRYPYTTCDKLITLVSSSSLLLPLVLVEIVHFCPFLFAYYVDRVIELNDLKAILLIFNVPKILFVVCFCILAFCVQD